jgi:hypothetical protein
MSNPRGAHCIFCDDLRYEVGNKISLMGMYSGDIVVPTPTVLAKLCIIVWVITDIDDPPTQLGVRVLGPPGGIELFKTPAYEPFPLAQTEGATKVVGTVTVQVTPFLLKENGYIEVMVDTDQGSMRAGRLMVRISPPVVDTSTSVQEPPPRASPSDPPPLS